MVSLTEFWETLEKKALLLANFQKIRYNKTIIAKGVEKVMQICICDDEKELRNSLSKIIKTELQLEGIPCRIRGFDSGNALLEGLKKESGDILFLDMKMNGLNGIDTASRIRKFSPDIVIIIVTAYPDYVFQGYEVRAFRYILKPYREDKIREVLKLAIKETRRLENQYYYRKKKGQVLRIPLQEIFYFKSDRKKVTAVTRTKEEAFYARLSDIEAELPRGFIRIHNRYLVNLRHVDRIGNTFCLCGGEKLPVSRACRQDLAVAFARKILNT